MLTEVKAYGFPADPLTLPLESEDSPIQIKDIQGLGPVKANINTTALNQRELLTGTSLGKRNIVLIVGLNPDWDSQTYESLRTLLYAYFMPQLAVKLRFTTTHMTECEISGIVEGCEPNMFTSDPEYQISVICPDPNFLAVTSTTVSGVTTATISESTTIVYEGTTTAGFLLTASPAVSHPVYDGVWRLNTSPPTNDMFFGGQVDSARIVELSTVPGQKFVRTRTPSTGLVKNMLSTVPTGTKWPVLRPGANVIALVTAEAGQPWTLQYTERFGGL